jgi:hypothetical protein
MSLNKKTWKKAVEPQKEQCENISNRASTINDWKVGLILGRAAEPPVFQADWHRIQRHKTTA